MNWVLFDIKERASFSPMHPQDAAANLQPPIPTPTLTPPPPSTHILLPFNLDNKISPSILLIILILAIIFFVSGLLHLLVRLLLRTPERDPDELEDVTALQGQLQQLFHLHDAGVDQSFIDTLPVFLYKAIIGLKDPFDCAVCLCEFEPEDKLRLLPRCSHAFHTECIDTWLLSHSTCPLCRAGLLLDFPSNSARSPVVFVLESGGESSREFGEAALGRTNSVFGSSSRLGIQTEVEFGSTQFELSSKSFEIRERKEDNVGEIQVEGDKIVQVKLGKFKNVDVGEGSSEDNVHSRRCYSMGSFAYVLDESSSMQVPIRTPTKKQSTKKGSFPINSGCRTAISEYGADSRRDFNGIEAFRSISTHHSSSGSKYAKRNGTVQTTKKESFSMSKIWMRGEKQQKCYGDIDSSKRAFSSRFPVGNSGIDSGGGGGCSGGHGAGRTISEGSEVCFDEETQSRYSLDSHEVMPQSTNTARTLLWLMGRQNKVAHSSCSSSFQ